MNNIILLRQAIIRLCQDISPMDDDFLKSTESQHSLPARTDLDHGLFTIYHDHDTPKSFSLLSLAKPREP
jgi:hypothetical protein